MFSGIDLAQEFYFLINTAVALFVIVDPFAVVPVYLTLTERFGREERRQIRRKASIVATVMLLIFALTGMKLFKLFGITMPAFQIAGGLSLLSFGISQLNRTRVRVTESEQEEGLAKDDISIFPLATPLLAGPGAISTVVLFSSESAHPLRLFSIIIAIVVAMSASHLLISSAPAIFRLLGRTGINLITRIMGMIVTAIAIQFIINGIKTAFEL